MADICAGLNVLELGSGSIAASMTGMVLADGGARVLKIEPAEGDRLRTANPSGFLVWNRGKESLVADLRTAEGQAKVKELAAAADVVIEAFAPGTSTRWGIDADALRAINPALVHLSITGFGKTGPLAGLKGYDSLVAARAGVWARGGFGHRDGALLYPVPWGSFGAAMQSVAGVMGALRVRDLTGRGQALDATLLAGVDPLDYFVSTIVQLAAKKGGAANSDMRASMAATRYGVLLVTKDGRFLQTSTLLPHQGKALCEVAGVLHALDDPRFARLPMFDNADDAQEWETMLLEAIREQDLDYWLPKFLASPDIAFEVAVTSEEGLDHPQFVHNGDVITINDPVLGPVREVGPVCHFADTPQHPTRSAPALGANDGGFHPHAFPAGGQQAPAHPFAGITIVEFGYFYAMPYGVAMAASMGARVIKLEDGNGDPHRSSFGPEVASNKTTAGKESVSVDLRTPEGRKIAQDIIATADVFLTGFRSGVADKWGLGYEELRAINPRLVYVHAGGYGTDGPYAHRALYAQAAQAAAGSFGRQVGYWSAPEQNADMSVIEMQAVVLPRLGQVVDGDSNAALAVVAALGLAIYQQQRTGKGQFVRTSMIAGNAWAYSDDFCSYAGKPPAALCDDEYFGTSALERVYQAADGTWVCLVVRTDGEFARLAAVVDPRLATDSRFASATARAANDDALIAALGAAFATRNAKEWEATLSAARVGCVEADLRGQPMVTSFEPALREAGLTVTFQHPMFGEMVRAAPPIAFSETPSRVGLPSARGQHNRAILTELGYDDAAIDALEANKIITPPA
ncbi:MAG: CoA transferase [Actinomycetota bacterium]|nr:CoA transferase [Actinomycetota bacterium]